MCQYAAIVELGELAPAMKERAVWARKMLLDRPDLAHVDEDELLAWVWHESDGVWYSIAGNYSKKSPEEKMAQRANQRAYIESLIDRAKSSAEEYLRQYDVTSLVRQKILERDNWTCQRCGQQIDRLEVHHIVKLRAGGVDASDNLATLCKGCHTTLDRKEYGLYRTPREVDVESV